MVKCEVLPDHLRCNRTDGRQWRCYRPCLAGKKLCEIHHLQGRHRQNKEKVPESLKIQRTFTKSKKLDRKTFKIGQKKRNNNILDIGLRKKGNVGPSEALDGALKKLKLKRGDLRLELIRVFLKRQVEKKKEKESRENSNEERELPNGLMEISPGRNMINANDFCNVKLGFDLNSISMRRFRSKNIEPFPIGTMQVLPFARDVAKLKKKTRKKCHWCRKTSYCSLIQCSSCKKEYFCTDCISERSSIMEEIVRIGCPVCRGTCKCRSCSKSQSEDKKKKDCLLKENITQKIQKLQYLIRMLLPVLRQVITEQKIELDLEAKRNGERLSEVQIQLSDSCRIKLCICNNCQTSIVDLHRSCNSCSYNLCLRCSKMFRGPQEPSFSNCRSRRKPIKSVGKLPKIKKMIKTNKREIYSNSLSPKWKACDDYGNINCPPKVYGGCSGGPLSLRCLFSCGWAEELESKAEEMSHECDFHDRVDDASLCKEMENNGIQASSRRNFEDNFLYHPYAEDICGKKLGHFQKHWAKGHPVIVRKVNKSLKDLSWDPIAMFCAYLEKKTSTRSRTNGEASEGRNCLDWCELEICRKQILMGSLDGPSYANMRDETMKMKLWLSSCLFRDQFPRHYADIINALPLQDYTNLDSGLYNLAANLSQDMENQELGPSMHISFGGLEAFVQAEFVTKLSCDSHDVVNILVHTTDIPISAEELTKIKTLMKKCNTRDHRDPGKDSTDLKLDNDSEEKSSVLSGNSEVSSLQKTTQEVLDLPNGVEDSESDSEPSIQWSGISLSSEESNDENIFRNQEENFDESADSCGALWDIFRRQDVPKLVEYLSRHSNEFCQLYGFPKDVVHPIYDQCFYLDEIHKRRLKEEFNIEPWTFKHHLGEAVIIPAGCPYQIRCIKSCVNIVLDFISPESATECIKLIDEQYMLPLEHKARKNLLEVKKMTLHSIHEAFEEIHDLRNAE